MLVLCFLYLFSIKERCFKPSIWCECPQGIIHCFQHKHSHFEDIIDTSPVFSRVEGGLEPSFQMSKDDFGVCHPSLAFNNGAICRASYYEALFSLVCGLLDSSVSGLLWALDICVPEGCKTRILWSLICGYSKRLSFGPLSKLIHVWPPLLAHLCFTLFVAK